MEILRGQKRSIRGVINMNNKMKQMNREIVHL